MPLDLAEGIFQSIFRFIAYCIGEIVIEIFVRGLGYILLRPFDKKLEYESVSVIIVGFIGWLAIVMGIFMLVDYLQLQSLVDSCLDQGNKFNNETKTCISA